MNRYVSYIFNEVELELLDHQSTKFWQGDTVLHVVISHRRRGMAKGSRSDATFGMAQELDLHLLPIMLRNVDLTQCFQPFVQLQERQLAVFVDVAFGEDGADGLV